MSACVAAATRKASRGMPCHCAGAADRCAPTTVCEPAVAVSIAVREEAVGLVATLDAPTRMLFGAVEVGMMAMGPKGRFYTSESFVVRRRSLHWSPLSLAGPKRKGRAIGGPALWDPSAARARVRAGRRMRRACVPQRDSDCAKLSTTRSCAHGRAHDAAH